MEARKAPTMKRAREGDRRVHFRLDCASSVDVGLHRACSNQGKVGLRSDTAGHRMSVSDGCSHRRYRWADAQAGRWQGKRPSKATATADARDAGLKFQLAGARSGRARVARARGKRGPTRVVAASPTLKHAKCAFSRFPAFLHFTRLHSTYRARLL